MATLAPTGFETAAGTKPGPSVTAFQRSRTSVAAGVLRSRLRSELHLHLRLSFRSLCLRSLRLFAACFRRGLRRRSREERHTDHHRAILARRASHKWREGERNETLNITTRANQSKRLEPRGKRCRLLAFFLAVGRFAGDRGHRNNRCQTRVTNPLARAITGEPLPPPPRQWATSKRSHQ